MSTQRDFDRIAAAWLAEGPSELADRVLGDALAEVHLTDQRRGPFAPWRYSPMNAFSRAAAAVLVVALAIGGAAYLLGRSNPTTGGPTALPSVSPSPLTPATQLPASALEPFTSSVYGYTINVPKGWGAQIATRTLHGTEPLYGNDPQVATPAGDSIMGGGFGEDGAAIGRLLIAGGETPAGTTLESWTADTAVVKCGAPTSQAAIRVDGEAATLTIYAACSGLFQQWVTVLHGGWAWHINWINNPGSESTDVVVFKQLLATFRFAGSSAAIPRGPIAGTYTTTTFTPAVTFTVGAGWFNHLEKADDFNLSMGDAAHQLTIARADGDPIRYARSNPDFAIGTPVATTVAGLPAQEVSLVLPPTAHNYGAGFPLDTFSLVYDRNPLAIQNAGSTSRVIWLQVGGLQVVIVIERPTSDTTDFDQQAQAILASMSFN